MKLPSPYQCDICGAQRRESNHWWLLLRDFCVRCGEPTIKVLLWADCGLDHADYHLCGLECVQKAVSKELERIRKEKDAEEQPTENV